MIPQRSDVLDAKHAIARMILTEVGLLEDQLIRWMREMCAIDPLIFRNLEAAWVQRHKQQIARYYNTVEHSFLDNSAGNYMPLAAAMDGSLINRRQLPQPPRWYRQYARENVSHTMGFATSKLFSNTDDGTPGAMRRPWEMSGMFSYIHLFSGKTRSLPDEKWFDQACHDENTVPKEFPHLYWLARELLLREDQDSPSEAMDDRFEVFQVPDTPRPSKKTLNRFSDSLGRLDGKNALLFARSLLQEYDRIAEDHFAYWEVTNMPRFYRAAVLPKFTRILNTYFEETGSILRAAERLIQDPHFYSFRHGRPVDCGIMTLGKHHYLRAKFPVRKTPSGKPGRQDRVITQNHPSSNIVPGCLCMIAAARDPADVAWLLPVCAKALKNEDVALFNRLIATVGEIASADAIRGLARLRAKTRHATMLSQLNVALAHAAARTGLTTIEAEELVAQTYGLDECHRRVETFDGGVTATLTLSGSGQGIVSYADPRGEPLRALPADIRMGEQSKLTLARLRADAKALTVDMAIHRLRLERSWLTGQSWAWPAFQQRWLAHPVLSWLARRQIWLAAASGREVFTCMIGDDGALHGPDGTRLSTPGTGLVLSLWHPSHDGARERPRVSQWRRRLEELAIEQPIRQAWRETYTISQEERESSPASYRYAGRILNQAQVVELGRKRGWRIRNLSPHLPSSESAPWSFSLPAHGLYAEWRAGGVGINHLSHSADVFSHVMTGRLRFCLLKDDGDWLYDGGRKLTETEKPVRLEDVSSVVFSEVMRDLDLMISNAASGLHFDKKTIYNIPDLDVWRRQAGLADVPLPEEPHFGGLAASRREEIANLVRDLNGRDRLRFEKRHVLIEGKRHQYQLHLGSGDVMILPHRRHLFLETRISQSAKIGDAPYKPLHDDDQIDLILHRILMLLRDDRIRDANILDQFADLPG